MAMHFLLTPAARDFPLDKIERMSHERAHALFAECRWGKAGTQVCPSCGTIAKHYWVKTRRQWRCREVACGRSFSVTSGTKWADHKLPLKTILKALLIFTANVKGISALAMSRQLGVNYQTAFVLIHKIRESIVEERDVAPLEGVVHIDGAHMSGRKRKPRVKEPATKRQARDRIPRDEDPKHKNRRIVMVMRQLSDVPGQGAVRTIVEVVPAENEIHVKALTRQYVKRGARVMTDEHPAYGMLMTHYEHETVNHSVEFSTDDGVSNNQAESYFSRYRRMEIGQVHRIAPKYMLDYSIEVGWREDARRTSTSGQVRSLLGKTLRKASRWWERYWQGHHRPTEVMFVPARTS